MSIKMKNIGIETKIDERKVILQHYKTISKTICKIDNFEEIEEEYLKNSLSYIENHIYELKKVLSKI
jgi:hypothetical protein